MDHPLVSAPQPFVISTHGFPMVGELCFLDCHYERAYVVQVVVPLGLVRGVLLERVDVL